MASQLQSQFVDFIAPMYHEGFLDNQFTEFQKLQNESNPDFVVEVVTLLFEDSERFLNNLATAEQSSSKDQNKLSAYRGRRFLGTQQEFEHALLTSTTLYVGNMSFYTTEEKVYELCSRAGEIKKLTMGLDKNTKMPVDFDLSCNYYSCLIIVNSHDVILRMSYQKEKML